MDERRSWRLLCLLPVHQYSRVQKQDFFYNYSQQENIQFMQADSVLFALNDARLFVDSLSVCDIFCLFCFSHAHDALVAVMLVWQRYIID